MRPKHLRIFSAAGLLALLLALTGAGSQTGAASTPGDVIDVVSLAGTNGALAPAIVPILTNGGAGTTGAPITLPANASHPLTISGSASSEGFLTLSGDGRYLTVTGYAGGTNGSGTARVIGRIDASGNFDTSTALAGSPPGKTYFTGNNIRSAVTDDGSRIWVTGAGSGDSPKTAVYELPFGGSSATSIVTPSPTGARQLVIAGGNLYYSTTTGAPNPVPGIYQVGSGLPTSAASPAPIIAGAALDPFGFAFVTLGAGSSPDTLYTTNGSTTGANNGITKYSLVGSSWMKEGTISLATPFFGLAAKAENGGVQIYATTEGSGDSDLAGNTVDSYFDASGPGGAIPAGATVSVVATAPGSTTYRGVSFGPTGQTLSPAPPTITLADSGLSRAIGDSFDPTQTTATISDTVYDASQLTVTATSDNLAVVPSVAVSGSGATRTITVDSNDNVGLANINLTVSTPDGRSGTATLQYGVSGPVPDPATSNLLYKYANASTAQDAGGGYYIVGDDEFNTLALYKGGVSGAPVTEWNFDPQMGVADSSQIDIEASALSGNTIYWFGSEGNNSSGKTKPDRQIVFATTISGSGASTNLTFAGFYRDMQSDLIAWDNANGSQFGFAAGAADGQNPKEVNGFNIEGAEFAAGGSSTLYLGFRAPEVPTTNRTKALVVPVTNLASLMSSSGTVGTATFGAPLLWDLTPAGYVNPNGDTSVLGVREIRKNAADQYLIIAGSYEGVPAAPTGGAEFLYEWDGNPAHQPVLTNTVLPTPDEGSWESIVSVPDPLVSGSPITMIEDNGDNDYYGTGVEAKDLTGTPSLLLKDRADVIDVALPAPTVTVPANETIEATGPSGASATFSVTATDVFGGSLSATCDHAPPSTFPLGTTTVTCTATSQGVTGSGTFTITVQDTTPPMIADVPANISVPISVAAGAPATYATPTATDVVSGSVPVSCSPASGSTFPVSTTTVTCVATDAAGNVATATFTVTVTKPSAAIVNGDVTCTNATYDGATIKGNVTVPAGSICRLINTSVSGNVQVHGGALVDDGSTVGGNLQTDGAAWIDLHGGDVKGNLQVQGVTGIPPEGLGDGSTVNDLCGASVGGNVQVQGNSAPFAIGAAPDCEAPLTIGGNLQVQNNTGGGTLSGNTASGNCQLQDDKPGIVGSGNSGRNNTCNRTA